MTPKSCYCLDSIIGRQYCCDLKYGAFQNILAVSIKIHNLRSVELAQMLQSSVWESIREDNFCLKAERRAFTTSEVLGHIVP